MVDSEEKMTKGVGSESRMFSNNLLVILIVVYTSSKIALHGCALLAAYPLA